MKKRKAVLWVEVHCDMCGEAVGCDYKNQETIANLKKHTYNWAICESEEIGTMQLCPDCIRKIERKEKHNG